MQDVEWPEGFWGEGPWSKIEAALERYLAGNGGYAVGISNKYEDYNNGKTATQRHYARARQDPAWRARKNAYYRARYQAAKRTDSKAKAR